MTQHCAGHKHTTLRGASSVQRAEPDNNGRPPAQAYLSGQQYKAVRSPWYLHLRLRGTSISIWSDVVKSGIMWVASFSVAKVPLTYSCILIPIQVPLFCASQSLSM